MIISNDMVKSNLTKYLNKNTKISRNIKNGKLFKIKNGLYETNPDTPGYLLAGSIYGPSYLSFDYALSYYGLIPEKVSNYTSATYGKKKKKQYTNYFGTFIFRDVPVDAYPVEVKLIEEDGYVYQIATKEKALCDKLYTLSPVHNLDELSNLLFNDLRVDNDCFNELNDDVIFELSNLYHSTNIDLLAKYIRRIKK